MRRKLLFAGDVAILYLSLIVTLLVRHGAGAVFVNNLRLHWLPFSIIFAFWLLVFYISNLYEISFTKNNLAFFTTFVYATAASAFFSIALFYLVRLFGITPRTNLFIFLLVETVASLLWRSLFNRTIARGSSRNHTLIVGHNPQAEELYDYLLANPQLGYYALGIIDLEHQQAADTLAKVVQEKKTKVLVLAPAVYSRPEITATLYQLLPLKLNFYSLPDFYELTTGRVPVASINQAWFLENLSEGGRHFYESVKRFSDCLLAGLISLLTLPFYPLIILAIKLDSPGPVFYRQRRVGQGGRIFSLIKFRTMRADAERASGPVWAAEDDTRSTRVGRFIRRSRLDELPQMWNILKGEMSFIGPRPERPEFHAKLKAEIPFYEERYLVRPGFTGWAQIKYQLDFKRGLTVADTFEKLQYDLFYIKNRSPFLDLSIGLKTINIVLRKLFSRF